MNLATNLQFDEQRVPDRVPKRLPKIHYENEEDRTTPLWLAKAQFNPYTIDEFETPHLITSSDSEDIYPYLYQFLDYLPGKFFAGDIPHIYTGLCENRSLKCYYPNYLKASQGVLRRFFRPWYETAHGHGKDAIRLLIIDVDLTFAHEKFHGLPEANFTTVNPVSGKCQHIWLLDQLCTDIDFHSRVRKAFNKPLAGDNGAHTVYRSIGTDCRKRNLFYIKKGKLQANYHYVICRSTVPFSLKDQLASQVNIEDIPLEREDHCVKAGKQINAPTAARSVSRGGRDTHMFNFGAREAVRRYDPSLSDDENLKSFFSALKQHSSNLPDQHVMNSARGRLVYCKRHYDPSRASKRKTPEEQRRIADARYENLYMATGIETLAAASRRLGRSYRQILRDKQSGKLSLSENGFWRYLHSSPPPLMSIGTVTSIREENQKNQQTCESQCDIPVKFSSIKEASLKLKKDRKTIYRYLNSGKISIERRKVVPSAIVEPPSELASLPPVAVVFDLLWGQSGNERRPTSPASDTDSLRPHQPPFVDFKKLSPTQLLELLEAA